MAIISKENTVDDIKRLSGVETRIMNVMWAANVELTSREIHDQCKDMNWKLPALMKQLDRLEIKGFISIDRTKRRNTYNVIISKSEYLNSQVLFLKNNLFGSNSAAFIESVMGALDMSDSIKKAVNEILKKDTVKRIDFPTTMRYNSIILTALDYRGNRPLDCGQPCQGGPGA